MTNKLVLVLCYEIPLRINNGLTTRLKTEGGIMLPEVIQTIKGGIYMITNLITGKRYIGQSKNIFKRLQHHISDSKNPKRPNYLTLIDSKIREYGEENFKFEVLLYVDNYSQYQFLESLFIIWYDTLVWNGKGYNKVLPIDPINNGQNMPVVQIDKNTKLEIARYDSAEEAGRKVNIDAGAIRGVCHKKENCYTAAGCYWAFANEFDSGEWEPQEYNPIWQKAVGTYIDGVLHTFVSASEASRQTGAQQSSITQNCNSKRKSAGGLVWFFI